MRDYALIDEAVVAQTFAMRREAATPSPVREGPILTPAWAYGSVIREKSGLFRMWYLGHPVYCEYYATSTDGIAWEKPQLDMVSPDIGAGPNAFLCTDQKDKNGRWLVGSGGPEGFSVLDAEVQPHPAAKARFTALYLAGFRSEQGSPEGSGLCIAYSDDGLNWIADEHNPIVSGWMDTSNCLIYDDRVRKYRIYGRPPVYVSLGNHVNRLISCMESEDLVHWSSPRTVLDTDDRDADAFNPTNEARLVDPGSLDVKTRGRDRQFYGITVFRSSGVYVGLAQIYDIPSGDTWLELCRSYDGLSWIREPLREPYIGPRPNTWESSQVRPAMASPLVRIDDELWIYYSASPRPHHSGKGMEGRGIGCRALKIDRWITYRSEDAEAELLTHPIRPGDRLWLNAMTQPGGWIRVGIIDTNGEVIEGLSHEDCVPITGDSIRHEVRREGNPTLPAHSSEIRLRIRSRNASLFAFYV